MTEEIATLPRARAADILRQPPARAWPSDARIADSIHLHAGILPLVASDLGLDEAKLSKYVNAPPALQELQRKVARSADWLMDRHIRQGCQEGDPGYIALRLRQQQLAAQRADRGVQGRDVVDYTREITGADDLTEWEIMDLLWRELAEHHRPADSEDCPICHRQAPGGFDL